MAMLVHAPCALGDLLDRITILAIKRDRVAGDARHRVTAEHDALLSAWAGAGLPEDPPERAALSAVNARLWEVEDALRAAESAGVFGGAFVDLARSVYRLNDERAALKRSVNLRFDSALVEEKVHPEYLR